MDISDIFKKLPAEINDPNRHKYCTSGVALIESTEKAAVLLVCHDNKKEYDPANALPSPRFGVVTLSASGAISYKPLEWPKKDNSELPEDLEGLSRFPFNGLLSFLALESKGRLFYFELTKPVGSENFTIRNAYLLESLVDLSLSTIGPNAKDLKIELEGFSVQRLSSATNDNFLAVWAHRGDANVPQGVIFWGAVEVKSKRFSCAGWHELVVRWPAPTLTVKKHLAEVSPVRQISGLKVLRDGTLLIASALDPGDCGPFVGAVYNAGSFEFANGKYSYKACKGLQLTEIFKTQNPGHKIEGMEELGDPPCNLVMVTDDEIFGPSIAIVDTPKP